MAATIAAHWYQQELGSPTSDQAQSRFPFLRLPYHRRRTSNHNTSGRPTSSKSNKSAYRPSTAKSAAPNSRILRRQSVSVHSVTSPTSTIVMKSPTKTQSRASYWRKKLHINFVPPLAYYGWGSPEEVKKVAAQSKLVVSLPPSARTATNDDDQISESQADDMILLTEMRAPSALGGLTLVESRRLSRDDELDQWPLREDPLQDDHRH